MLFLSHMLFFFLVKTWCPQYPQCNSTANRSVVLANVARGTSLKQRLGANCRALVSSLEIFFIFTCSCQTQPILTQVKSLEDIYKSFTELPLETQKALYNFHIGSRTEYLQRFCKISGVLAQEGIKILIFKAI